MDACLILMDINLPLLNGFEILQQKALDARIASIPTIVLTNSYHPVTGTEIEKLDVVDFMVKSDVTPEIIMERVGRLFSDINENSNLRGKKIMLVEDDAFLGSIMMSRIEAAKAEGTLAKNGEDALEQIAKTDFDLVLLDILLPGISGFDVLESIRANPKTKDLPVAIVSNFNQVKDKERAASLGAPFFVKALVTPDDILEEAKKLLVK